MIDPFAPAFGAPVAPWHKHFAWRPANTVDRGWTWLRFVSRRRIQKHDYLPGGADQWWQYASRYATRHHTQQCECRI